MSVYIQGLVTRLYLILNYLYKIYAIYTQITNHIFYKAQQGRTKSDRESFTLIFVALEHVNKMQYIKYLFYVRHLGGCFMVYTNPTFKESAVYQMRKILQNTELCFPRLIREVKTGDKHRHTSGSILAKQRTGAERLRVWAIDGGKVCSE